MDERFHLTHFTGYNYLSIVRLKLVYICKIFFTMTYNFPWPFREYVANILLTMPCLSFNVTSEMDVFRCLAQMIYITRLCVMCRDFLALKSGFIGMFYANVCNSTMAYSVTSCSAKQWKICNVNQWISCKVPVIMNIIFMLITSSLIPKALK